VSTQLPYVFDLLYDFKTLEQLNDHLSGKQRSATSATDAALRAFAIELGVEGVEGVENGETQETQMAAMLRHLTKPECGLMPDLVTKINELLSKVK
jgi:hypothetical protein